MLLDILDRWRETYPSCLVTMMSPPIITRMERLQVHFLHQYHGTADNNEFFAGGHHPMTTPLMCVLAWIGHVDPLVATYLLMTQPWGWL
jgi:hypothetical protein